jgi:Uma2 family endonuclease
MPTRAKLTPMNVPLRKAWTQEEFFPWAEAQDVRYEFDGVEPVAMTGGNAGHDVITFNIRTCLRNRLRGSSCRPFGPNAGVETIDKAVRYPDGVVTCSKVESEARVIPDAVIVFEVVSPSSGRTDRIVKVREYAAVPSIRRYVIVESSSMDLTVMERSGPDEIWRTTVLTKEDVLRMPEIGIEIPIAEFYEDITIPEEGSGEG